MELAAIDGGDSFAVGIGDRRRCGNSDDNGTVCVRYDAGSDSGRRRHRDDSHQSGNRWNDGRNGRGKSMTKAKATKTRATRRAAATHGPKDKASEHYHREKARRERQATPENDVMAEARREYLALLESDAAKGKGGRPKKKVVP